jgi:hypothetical protein
MQWVTRQRPKIDRLACPWLITRFIDKSSEFLFVPADQVRQFASATGAIPFDVPGVELSPEPGGCSFHAFLTKYRLKDPALRRIGAIVLAADNGNLAAAPEAAGLRAISLGLAGYIRNDHERLAQGLVLYDALYRWARKLAPEAAIAVRPERGLALWLARYRERRALAGLDNRMLSDIGVSPADAQIEAGTPCWRPSRSG